MQFFKKNSSTLTKWKRARFDFAQATQAIKALVETSKKHRSKHPLDETTVAAILAAFVQGKPLCCETGLKTLAEIGLDECWIVYLNDWAYEYLSCTGSYQPDGSHYEASLKKLRCKLGSV